VPVLALVICAAILSGATAIQLQVGAIAIVTGALLFAIARAKATES
jgi:hypothetical protein